MANNDFYNAFSTLKEYETDGIWLDVFSHKNGDVASFKVRRLSRSNNEYRRALQKATKPYATMIEAGTIDPVTERKLMTNVFVNTVLVDWKNIPDGFGEYMEFSKDAAVELLMKMPDLYDMLEKESSNMANFQHQESLDAIVKN